MSNLPVRFDTRFHWLVVGLLACMPFSPRSDAQCQWQWGPGSGLPGVDQPPTATVVFDDGTGPALYVAGQFTTAGSVPANYIARWDGVRWTALGSGLNDFVYALTVFDDGGGAALYAAGEFTTAGGVSAVNIAKWNGANWSAVGVGGNILAFDAVESIDALAVFDDGEGPALYAGGHFFTRNAQNEPLNNIGKWDGAAWSPVGTGVGSSSSHNISVLKVFDDGGGPALYAGGRFTTAGGASANHIAKWNGVNWSAMGSGMDNYITALTVFDDGGGPALYAGGVFATAGGTNANRIAKWNSAAWSALGSGMNGVVSALAVFDDGMGSGLYAGGFFASAGGVNASGIAKWNGTSWSSLGSGVDGNGVSSMVGFDDGSGTALFAVGNFTTAGGVVVSHIARWGGAAWSALGSGTNGSVQALAVFNNGGGPALYAGGYFTAIGGVSANALAMWNGVSWSPLAIELDSAGVEVLQVFDDGGGPALYAGGGFRTAAGATLNRIGKWNGTNWSALGSGMDNSVHALAVFNDGGGPSLYAAGEFTTAGGISANGIAKWDGTNWSALGSGLGLGMALAVFDDGGGPALYAGDGAGSPGGVFKWDGTSWSPLGLGLDSGGVYALTVFDEGGGSVLYAGGGFTSIPTEIEGVYEAAPHIAKWNGTNWSALGSGMDYAVRVLTVFDDGGGPNLYAGGDFVTAGGISANHISRWKGNWLPLGSGMNGTVRALTGFDDGGGPALYAGGNFTTAGGRLSAFFAKWSCRSGDLTRAISFTPTSVTPPAAARSRHHQIADQQGKFDSVSSLQTGNAIRVTLDSLHHVEPPYTGGPSVPFTSFEGQVRWVGPPAQYPESSASGISFLAAQLQCTPHYQDWSTVGLLSVFGSAIVPSSNYRVEMLAGSCQGNEVTCTAVSAPLIAITTRWGDVETPYNPPDATTQPDLADVGALVNKFRSAPGAPIKARALLAGDDTLGNISTNTLSLDFNFSHIAACVDAFRGKPYPYAVESCP